AVIVRGLLVDPGQGIDAGPLLAAVVALVGGYAMAGRGPGWNRAIAALAFATTLYPFVATTGNAGPSFALDTPHGLWAYLTSDGLLVLLALATSVPLRTAVRCTIPHALRTMRPGHRGRPSAALQ